MAGLRFLCLKEFVQMPLRELAILHNFLILNVYEQKVFLELADLYVGRNVECWFRFLQ